jgi:3-oxoadipate enol-lactonase
MSTVELNHRRSGAAGAPVLLLGPSLGTTLEMWTPALATLARGHDVVRFDHRGQGGSPEPPGPYAIADLGNDVLALLDRLELERVSYAGVSLGGMVGLWLAANAPRRIERLVCICSSAHLPPAEAWAARAASVRAAASVAVVADAVIARWFTPAYATAHADAVAPIREMLERSPPEGYAACCEAIGALDLRSELSLIAAPTLVIAAEQDAATPPEHSRLIAGAVAGASLHVLECGAHLAAIECAGEVAALIESHLEGP